MWYLLACCMRLKTNRFSPRGNPLCMIKVMRRCLRALDMWRKPWFLSQRPGLGAPCRCITLAMDASLTVRERSWVATLPAVCGVVAISCGTFNSIQDYLYSAFYDTIIAKQLYRKLSFYNRFIHCRNLIYLTYGKIVLILYTVWGISDHLKAWLPTEACVIPNS